MHSFCQVKLVEKILGYILDGFYNFNFNNQKGSVNVHHSSKKMFLDQTSYIIFKPVNEFEWFETD